MKQRIKRAEVRDASWLTGRGNTTRGGRAGQSHAEGLSVSSKGGELYSLSSFGSIEQGHEAMDVADTGCRLAHGETTLDTREAIKMGEEGKIDGDIVVNQAYGLYVNVH